MNTTIIESAYHGTHESCETARSIKRRKNKRWATPRYTVVWVPCPDVLVTPFGIVCSPEQARELRKVIEAKP